MQVYKYPYANVVGEYIVLSEVDAFSMLVYSRTTQRFPKFMLILTDIHELSVPLEVDNDISHEQLVDEYLAFKMSKSMRSDTGQCKILEACTKLFQERKTDLDADAGL